VERRFGREGDAARGFKCASALTCAREGKGGGAGDCGGGGVAAMGKKLAGWR
jgi:hypothetical protein